MRLRGIAVISVISAVFVLIAGCTSNPGGSDAPEGLPTSASAPVRQPETGPPASDVTVVSGQAAAELAIGASQALYREAPLVLLAGADDLAGQAAAAPVAVALGVPLLLLPEPPEPEPAPGRTAESSPGRAAPDWAGGALARELARLEPDALLVVGDGPERWSRRWAGELAAVPAPAVVPAPADPAGLAVRAGVPLGAPQRVTAAELVAAVAELRRDRPARLALATDDPPPEQSRGLGPAPTATPPADPSRPPAEPALPRVVPPVPLDTLTVLAPDATEPVAAVATARAAGARVLVTGATDPRTDPDLIAALADQPPTHTLALGDRFGPADRLRRRQAVAATGVELPGGGQVIFPGRRFVALYGHPGAPVLGVLGEQGVDAALARAEEVAADYRSLVDEPVVPTFEIITTIASAGPGPHGDYSRRTPVDTLRPWIKAAGAAGVYVTLDLQPGRTDFLTQAKEYEELLREPHVGLALDPEWRLGPDQRHLAQIGSVGIAEVNRVVDWLADLTAQHRLPQKLLVLHQFTLRMITDRHRLDTGRDELAVLIHADGFGTPGQKLATWDALRANAPPDVWWGWKNFYDEDEPTFTPARTVRISPSPVFISYQ